MTDPARQTRPWASAGRDAVAGALSGAFSRTVTAPIERVKLIMQLQNSKDKAMTTVATANRCVTAFSVTKQIIETEGVWAFWRGNLQNVLRAGGQAALNFALMDYYKGLAHTFVSMNLFPPRSSPSHGQHQQRFSPPSWFVSFVAGGLAGGTATSVLYPTEFLRTRLALDQGRRHSEPTRASPPSALNTQSNTLEPRRQYRGMVDAVKKIVKTDGIAGIYQGYGISLFGSIIYRLLYLGGYDACKAELVVWKRNQQQEKHRRKNEGASSARDGPNYDLYANSEDDSSNDLVAAYEAVPAVSLAWAELFWLAQFVSLASGTLCYPIDSVRRRMMMQAGKPLDERQYLTSMQCFWKIWTNEGLRGFYLGIGPNLFRSFGGALALVAYDGFKTILASNQ